MEEKIKGIYMRHGVAGMKEYLKNKIINIHRFSGIISGVGLSLFIKGMIDKDPLIAIFIGPTIVAMGLFLLTWKTPPDKEVLTIAKGQMNEQDLYEFKKRCCVSGLKNLALFILLSGGVVFLGTLIISHYISHHYFTH